MTAPRHLDHVYWIGGGSGAGKSTIARRLAAEHGLDVYETDEVMEEHAARMARAEHPRLAEFLDMDMDERWVNRDPVTMLETFHWFAGEGFPLVVGDLEARPSWPAVIAEGFRLLPSLVAPYLTDCRRSVWLLPTPEFRRAAFESRGTSWTIAARTSDPPLALGNLLDRDRMFTDRLHEETERLGLPTIDVDETMTEDTLAALVAEGFGLR